MHIMSTCTMYFILLSLNFLLLCICDIAYVVCVQQCHSDMCKILTKNIDCIIDFDLTFIIKRCRIVLDGSFLDTTHHGAADAPPNRACIW